MKVKDFIPKNQYRYYYTTLSEVMRKPYDSLVCGLLAFKDDFVVDCSSSALLTTIFTYAKYDIPELFYVKNISLRYYEICPTQFRVYPAYRFQENKTCSILQEIESKYRIFINTNINKADIIKEQAIHDTIAKSVQYKDVDKPYSHEAPGPLLYDLGVCEGISKAAKYLCDRVGLKCAVAVGNVNENEEIIPHAWNIIWIDNSPYHVDITYDNGMSGGGQRYDYFNLSDIEMLSDRARCKEFSLPYCSRSRNWYKENNLFFQSKSELIRKLKNLPAMKSFSFQLPVFSGRCEEAKEMVNILISEYINPRIYYNKTYSLHYNLNRMVFEVVFSNT